MRAESFLSKDDTDALFSNLDEVRDVFTTFVRRLDDWEHTLPGERPRLGIVLLNMVRATACFRQLASAALCSHRLVGLQAEQIQALLPEL
jgi:predicted small integral membrane protein